MLDSDQLIPCQRDLTELIILHKWRGRSPKMSPTNLKTFITIITNSSYKDSYSREQNFSGWVGWGRGLWMGCLINLKLSELNPLELGLGQLYTGLQGCRLAGQFRVQSSKCLMQNCRFFLYILSTLLNSPLLYGDIFFRMVVPYCDLPTEYWVW